MQQELNTYEILQKLTETMVPVDVWYTEAPEDIEIWQKEWEFNKFTTDFTYTCLTKIIYDGKDSIINGYISRTR
jgi:oligoribonuclease NrnB/cAMP/cGMP phosphodiesterase (DHH superfamily)